ncbi:aspartic peptidase domain-containing protein [Gorgonomyces haynaldii]|nr:aspartic peptidase domain-containing protein [Gorgonomyces haynaldii]
MGLGFPAKANGSYFAQLVASGKIKAPVFSYYITQNAKSGGLTLGGIDTARFGGDILWAPLVPESNNQFSYWKVAVTGVTAGPQGISLPPGFSMITDTGTSLSIFPKDVANAINTGLGLQKINDVYGIPCPNGTNALPPQLLNLTLSLATGNLVITPKEYLYQLPSNLILNQTICASTIIGGNTNVTLVGNAFLQRFYLVHDYGKKKLGFAVANRDVQVESQFVELDSTNPPKGKWQSPETYPPGSNTTETTLKNSASVYSATLLSAVVALILMH